MIEDTLNAIVSLVSQGGGEVLYQSVYDTLPFEQRQLLPQALKLGKANGQVRRRLVFADGQNTLYITSNMGG